MTLLALFYRPIVPVGLTAAIVALGAVLAVQVWRRTPRRWAAAAVASLLMRCAALGAIGYLLRGPSTLTDATTDPSPTTLHLLLDHSGSMQTPDMPSSVTPAPAPGSALTPPLRLGEAAGISPALAAPGSIPGETTSQGHASITQGGNILTGRHLILREAQQAADALGPGTFTAAVDEADPSARLNVTWSDEMQFRNADGRASFLGNVHAVSTSATDDTSLDAHHLTLTFLPQNLSKPGAGAGLSGGAVQAPDQAGSKTSPDPSVLDLRHVRATADPDDSDQLVHFITQTFGRDDIADKPLTRLTLEGRQVDFVNQPIDPTNDTSVDDFAPLERLVVPTRGRLLLEDYRTAAKPDPTPFKPRAERGSASEAPDPPDDTSGGPVNFAGRGLTLFAWENQLTLDAQSNDLRLEGDVWMLHQPASDELPIKLDAQLLVADLTETGGLGAYLAGGAPSAQIRQVNADGRVRVAQGPTSVVADHLEYIEAQRRVVLWAEPRRVVTLNHDDQPNPQTAKAFIWNLDTNLFEARSAGPGLVPIE